MFCGFIWKSNVPFMLKPESILTVKVLHALHWMDMNWSTGPWLLEYLTLTYMSLL